MNSVAATSSLYRTTALQPLVLNWPSMNASRQHLDRRNFSFFQVTTAAFVLIAYCGCEYQVETPSTLAAASSDSDSARDISDSEKTDTNSTNPIPNSTADERPARPVDQNAADRTFYVTPTGDGRMDGSDWANAATAASLQELLSEKVTAGDRVVLGSGQFPQFSVSIGGSPSQQITITGTDTGGGLPSIQGRWKETNPKYHAHSWNAISLADGVSHVRIGGLQFSGFLYGVKATNNRDIELFDLSISRCREGISLNGLTDSTIRNCQMIGYAKRGIRFDRGCHDLVVADVAADATGGQDAWPTEAFPFGFAVEDGDGNHSIRFERCTARNNVFPGEPGKYWNGDGFVAENNSYDLTYVDCMSIGNSDGGWDDKSRAPRLIGCIAARNKRGFRLWNVRGDNEHPARLENCLGVYNKSVGGSGSSDGLWLCGTVEAERCTFHNNATAAIAIENNGPGGKLRAVDCILSSDSQVASKPLVLKESGTTYEAIEVVQWNGSLDDDPQYKAASSQWDGDPLDAFNSLRYGSAKGFRHGSGSANN